MGLGPGRGSFAGEDHLHVATVAASKGEFATLDEITRGRQLASFKALANSCADLVVFDVPAGMSSGPLIQVASAVDHLILVVIPERTALAEAYAVLKEIARRRRAPEVSILFNRGRSTAELGLAAQRLIETATRYLQIRPRLLGWVPFDEVVGRSIAARVPFVRGDPEARASQAVRAIAHRLAGMPRLDPPRLELVPRPRAGSGEPEAVHAAIRKAS
jgi:flagellar biosynthesis protein FlhG